MTMVPKNNVLVTIVIAAATATTNTSNIES